MVSPKAVYNDIRLDDDTLVTAHQQATFRNVADQAHTVGCSFAHDIDASLLEPTLAAMKDYFTLEVGAAGLGHRSSLCAEPVGMSAQRIRIREVGRDDLLAAAAAAGEFQVSGFAGSGHSLLTDAFGADVFIGKDVAAWSAPVLFLMRQTLTADQVDVVTCWGVADPFETVRALPFGHAVMMRRH